MRISDWSSDVCSSDLALAPYDVTVTPACSTSFRQGSSMKRLATLLLACTATAAFAQTPGTPAFTAAGVRAHAEFLADDLLEGRDIGRHGHEIAARYVASEFDAVGLQPASAHGTANQPIPLQQR